MHVWLTIPSLANSRGGPSAVVQNLSEHLVSQDVRVSVLTCRASVGQSEALPRDDDVRVIRVPGSGRGKQGFGAMLEQGLFEHERTVVHDFGLWLPANHSVAAACSALGVGRVCSPMGMLAPWALAHKAWKKRIAWWLYQHKDLRSASVLAATAEQERRDIRRRVPGKAVATIPHGVEIPGLSNLPSRNPQKNWRTVVFLGRIHPVKGLKHLLEAWRLVCPAGWKCVLAGPDEAGHRAELTMLLRSWDLGSVFEFSGMVQGTAKWALLRQADLFVLPSFTENFGLVVAEALACEVPVIASKGTPWSDLHEHGCGYWVDIGVGPLAEALRKATSLDDSERCEMGRRGRRLVVEHYCWPRVAELTRSVYEWTLSGGTPPACVHIPSQEP